MGGVSESRAEREGWPVGITREQMLAGLGLSREQVAECESLAALSEDEFEALLLKRSEERRQLIGTS
jgi:hypothetical protein